MLTLVFASDSFKGSLSSEDTARMLSEAATKHLPGCRCVAVPMADGGEGTCDVLVRTCGGSICHVSTVDPLGRTIEAAYAELPGKRAVIEVAAASGLPLLADDERNPLRTSSYGTGLLVRDALNRGATDITIALGGSATNDGGMGLLRALGVRFLDDHGAELQGCGSDLSRVANMDCNGLVLDTGKVSVSVMCDVDNPLLGPMGATATFAPQKGATPEMLTMLEEGMSNYAHVLETCTDTAVDIAGAGAAGGLGAACMAVLGARPVSGAARVLELVGFDALLDEADLVVTGEGHLDAQTAHGKVVSVVGEACARKNVPCVALVGGVSAGVESLQGVSAIMATENDAMPLSEAMERAEELYRLAAERLFALVGIGCKLKR